MSAPETDLTDVADRFVLTAGQIRDAAAEVRDMEMQSGESLFPTAASSPLTASASSLFAAARAQSDHCLGGLAVRVRSRAGWNDLVLPAASLERVQEVSAAIRNQRRIYAEWGFARRLPQSQGVKALFLGEPGTGKTMAAGVIAADLGLDLYKIDLSGVVSKYIGETEKNLDRIFEAARSSNAILFFDEADALFGKRSEVRDAHDRYANIELAYLLQKLEEFPGTVFLASNLGANIDAAFSRRMQYVVEFPLPDEAHRERLWREMFPPQAPLDADVDFGFLAAQFSLAGGDIKNVALNAAFLAAQARQSIGMSHLIRAMARQMRKQGKLPSVGDFQRYFALIAEE